MKRLIKKANIDYNLFLTSLINYNDYSQDEIQTVIDNNPDCIFDGFAFRVLYFHPSEVKEARDNYMKSANIESVYSGDMVEILWGTLDNLIRVNNLYQSFTKSQDALDKINDHLNDENDIGIIIKFAVSKALDIKKLYQKYESQLNDETKDAHSYFEHQEEVLAKFDSDEFNFMGSMGYTGDFMNTLRYLK